MWATSRRTSTSSLLWRGTSSASRVESLTRYSPARCVSYPCGTGQLKTDYEDSEHFKNNNLVLRKSLSTRRFPPAKRSFSADSV